MANLQLDNLTKHYKQGKSVIRALAGVTLDIGDGEFVAVVGRSGSGKTTMLDMLGLLLRPTAGRLMLDGTDTTTLGDRDLARLRGTKVGFVFQEYNLLPSLNVLENVMLPLRYVRGNGDGRKRAEDLLERVGLSDRVRHRATELSGGQQQRVAIARSMVNQPSLILLDEPTGAVDTETAEQLVALLKSLNEQDRVTIVVVTHDLDVAKEAKRQVRLKDGKVVADEAVSPVAAAPA
ncbi:MAG: ABC transporter ATP-binding protein [Candidatus Dormibacteraeota bacterium]|nr:ABC transporter ATP-binding protein [Candidatus Dormibacteraeota bacterium]